MDPVVQPGCLQTKHPLLLVWVLMCFLYWQQHCRTDRERGGGGQMGARGANSRFGASKAACTFNLAHGPAESLIKPWAMKIEHHTVVLTHIFPPNHFEGLRRGESEKKRTVKREEKWATMSLRARPYESWRDGLRWGRVQGGDNRVVGAVLQKGGNKTSDIPAFWGFFPT